MDNRDLGHNDRYLGVNVGQLLENEEQGVNA